MNSLRDGDAAERAVSRVHGRLGELVCVHLTEALVALDRILARQPLLRKLGELPLC